MKKSKLKCALLGAIATLSFIACNTSTTPEAAKTETQKPTETPAPVQQKEYKSTELFLKTAVVQTSSLYAQQMLQKIKTVCSSLIKMEKLLL